MYISWHQQFSIRQYMYAHTCYYMHSYMYSSSTKYDTRDETQKFSYVYDTYDSCYTLYMYTPKNRKL